MRTKSKIRIYNKVNAYHWLYKGISKLRMVYGAFLMVSLEGIFQTIILDLPDTPYLREIVVKAVGLKK